jgi:hypothetical protein
VQKKSFSKKTIDVAFSHKFENGEKGFKKKLKLSMLGSNLKNIVLQTFEFCSDCRCDDRHFADIKTQFSIPRKT